MVRKFNEYIIFQALEEERRSRYKEAEETLVTHLYSNYPMYHLNTVFVSVFMEQGCHWPFSKLFARKKWFGHLDILWPFFWPF